MDGGGGAARGRASARAAMALLCRLGGAHASARASAAFFCKLAARTRLLLTSAADVLDC